MLTRFLRHLRHELGVDDPLTSVSTDDLRQCQVAVVRERSAATAQNYVKALRRLFAFLLEEGERDDNPALRLKAPRLPSKVRQPLSKAELSAIFKACDRDKTLLGMRDRALFTFMLDCGVRAAELCALKVADVDFDQRLTVVRRGKGGKGRVVGLSAETLRLVDRYLRRRRAEEGDPLFAGRTGAPLKGMGLFSIAMRRGKEAGIERRVHPHLFRHTAATALADAGLQEGELRSLMGWSPGSEMVYRYTSTTLADRARTAQRRANVLDTLLR
jgi:integrase